MARKYSDKTLAAFVRFLDAKFTHAGKDVLFLSASVPEEFDIGGGARVSGMKRAFGVVTKIAEGSRHFHRPKTSCLIFQVERCALRALA